MVAASSGVSIPAIIAVSALGLALIIALFKEYDCKFKHGPDGFEAEFKCKSK